MDGAAHFSKILAFFQNPRAETPGDPEYEAGLCRTLMEAAAAEEASIWRRDREGRLHLIYGTNVAPQEISDVTLREGEGISGAAALSREAIAVSDAWAHPQHDRRVDRRIRFRTRSMISAPILYDGMLYGVVNILNHTSSDAFPEQWQERLASAGAMYGAALAAAGRLHPYKAPTEGDRTRSDGDSRASHARTIVVGVSGAVQEALHLCLKAAKTHMPVLIRGETGTGKELAARRIHEAGNRASGPFLDVNCAALAETLLESELFGHVKGAFSGANRDRKGKFCAASGGTLFLDEIGEMSLSCQVKILRVLQEKRVTPVGAESSMTCDARIVAATHHNLRALVEEGRFREDLFYRLCGMEILMPPLRERVEDIPLLCIHFLKEVAEEDQPRDPYQEPLSLSTEALDMLMNYDWPGNVRQLEQALMAAMAICESEEIRPEDFPTWLHTEMRATGHARVPQPPGPDPRVEAVPKGKSGFSPEERARYLKALESTKYPGTGRWNLSKAANQLGIPRKTFAYRLKRLGVIL